MFFVSSAVVAGKTDLVQHLSGNLRCVRAELVAGKTDLVQHLSGNSIR